MRVRITGDNECGEVRFIREVTDPKFYGAKYATGESALFHFIKKWLNERGFDCIKKRAQSDGHMVGDQYQPYLRDRKGKWCIISGFYALRDANKDWNEGCVDLNFHGDAIKFREKLEGASNARD
jgi:hypothetical protein